jgi:GH24 family phage-related lysozyme (muramidase)
METSRAGLDLIKSFEGLRLEAYPDPGTGGEPWTIGYGHTGGVKPGEKITKENAEQLLKLDLARFERAVSKLITVPLTQNEFDALVSFTFNVGEGALEDSTLRIRLNKGEPKATVLKEELPRWNKGGSGVMEGLVRRRAAEVKLATEQVTEQVSFLEKAAIHYKGEPHQLAAYRWLESVLDKETLEGFKARYRGAQAPVVEHPPLIAKFPLDVPYFYQRDSKTGHGERSCFSSAMAMAIEYLDPEAIDGDDDTYLRQVFKYGDTVSSDAQIKAAKSLGVPAKFRTDGTEEDLERLLDEGIPVPIGILHKGHVTKPTGGGHWICLIGYDKTHFFVHDPFGELDLVNGGYPKAGPTDGKNKRYSKKNLLARWLIRSDHDGWLCEFD